MGKFRNVDLESSTCYLPLCLINVWESNPKAVVFNCRPTAEVNEIDHFHLVSSTKKHLLDAI